MNKNRLEAFSDGVIAIIITIMVLELKIPHGASLDDLIPLLPIFLGYVLSFMYIGIYWANHHHLLMAVKRVNGPILWANTHLLFWLSLTPFVTAWASENHFESVPVAAYGFCLLMSSVAYFILTRALIRHHEKDSELTRALGSDFKGKASTAIYLMAMPVAYFAPYAALALYLAVAIWWIVPDLRFERVIGH